MQHDRIKADVLHKWNKSCSQFIINWQTESCVNEWDENMFILSSPLEWETEDCLTHVLPLIHIFKYGDFIEVNGQRVS